MSGLHSSPMDNVAVGRLGPSEGECQPTPRMLLSLTNAVTPKLSILGILRCLLLIA